MKAILQRLVGVLLNTLAVTAPRLAGNVSFFFFARPKRKKPKPEEESFLATADVHYETVNGLRYAVYRWGAEGPVALLVHGWESQSGRWRKVALRLLEAGFRVVAVDAPAHGRSEGRRFTMIRYAEVLRTLLQRIGPVDTVVAHSVGGASSIWAMATADAGHRPRKAVILAAFSALQTIMEDARATVGGSRQLMQAMDDYVERLTGARIEHYSLARAATELGAVETLLIHDRHDRVTAFGESEILHRAWPGARFWATEGYGHGLTAPEVTEAVLAFVEDSKIPK